MKLEQLHIAVDRAIQLQSADQLVDRPDTTIADRPCSFGNHISDIGVLKHRLRLVIKVFSLKSFLEISLVSLQNVVVSFVHLECAPLIVVVTCKFLLQPITTHIPGMFHLFSKKTTLVLGLVRRSASQFLGNTVRRVSMARPVRNCAEFNLYVQRTQIAMAVFVQFVECVASKTPRIPRIDTN